MRHADAPLNPPADGGRDAAIGWRICQSENARKIDYFPARTFHEK